MRLQKYILNEENITKTVLSFILDKCKPFLKELTRDFNNINFMYSGRDHKEPYFIGKVRKNRKPLTTPENKHNTLDKLFNDKFGWKARSNAVFCTGSIENALRYSHNGLTHMIFPIGKYKYLWNPRIIDLYTEIDDIKPETKVLVDLTYVNEIQQYVKEKMKKSDTMTDIAKYRKEIINKIIDDNIKDNIEKYKKYVNGYKSTGLNQALKSKNEIMVNCKTYYAVNSIYDGAILNYLLEYGLSKEGLNTIQ